MKRRTLLLLVLGIFLFRGQVSAQTALETMVNRELPSLVEIYKQLHAAPELSHREEKTAAFFAAQLRAVGFTVTERVGKYERPEWTSYGVVAVMKNGAGPTVLLRTDLDGLPVEEKTGLPYASKVRTKNDAGVEVPVMHACGHDVHMTSMLGTAKMLSQLKERWKGTLVIIGQPAEETIDGARAMLRDGLYERFPRPDFALTLHDSADYPAGSVAYIPGFALASSTTVDITIRGIGGHGSRPDATKDPIVLAAQVIVGLQTIVSREVSPLDSAVVTVGSIHGGTKHNIIPDDVELLLTVRAYKEEVRQKVLAAIERITRGTAVAAGIPENRMPLVRVSKTEAVGATYNDPALTERTARAFIKELGEANVLRANQIMGAEDFGYFGVNGKVPTTLFWLGVSDPAKLKQSAETGVPLPGLHSPLFAPLPEPTLRTGVRAMTAAVLDLMG